MKRLLVFVVLAVLMMGIGSAFGDTWTIEVQTGPGPPTVPLNSTGLLYIDNFSISALATISDESFNASISQLSFVANVSAEEGSVSGQNINITMPTDFVNGALYGNETILTYISVDGKGNGYTLNQVNDSCVLGFYLYAGTHTVSLDIALDPPIATVPEFSPLMLDIVFGSLLVEAGLFYELHKRLEMRKVKKAFGE